MPAYHTRWQDGHVRANVDQVARTRRTIAIIRWFGCLP